MNKSNTALTSRTGDVIAETSRMIDKLVEQVRGDIMRVDEPKAQALFETTAEVLLGLKKAYQDYKEGNEKAWQ